MFIFKRAAMNVQLLERKERKFFLIKKFSNKFIKFLVLNRISSVVSEVIY